MTTPGNMGIHDAVLEIADRHADEFVGALTRTLGGQVFDSVTELRKKLAGAYLLFLNETVRMVGNHERCGLVPEEAGCTPSAA